MPCAWWLIASKWGCLQACLMLVEKRETRYRVQWYYRLFEETRYGLQPNQALEVCHGSLLALGELLCHTGALACRAAAAGVCMLGLWRIAKALLQRHVHRLLYCQGRSSGLAPCTCPALWVQNSSAIPWER